MTTFWRRGADNLRNGTILGAILALAIISGDAIYSFIQANIPESWMVFGNLSIPVYLISLFAIIGYWIDRH